MESISRLGQYVSRRILVALPLIGMLLSNAVGQGRSTEDAKIIRGTWVLTSLYKTSNITGIDGTQQQRLLASRISYSSKELTACAQSVSIVSLDVHRLSAKDFFAQAYVRLDEVGVKDPTITEIIINRNESGNCFGTYTLPGENVYIRNNNELLINFEGAFYRAIRTR